MMLNFKNVIFLKKLRAILKNSRWLPFLIVIVPAALAAAILAWRSGSDGPWKEMSAIVAGSLAILAVILDPRDEQKKLTTPGRAIVSLTIVSAIFSIVAQFRETSQSEERTAANQRQMLALLDETQAAIRDLSRSMQLIENPVVTIDFNIDCQSNKFKAFCDKFSADNKWIVDRNNSMPDTSGIEMSADALAALNLDFENQLHFYRSKTDAEAFAKSACKECFSEGQLYSLPAEILKL